MQIERISRTVVWTLSLVLMSSMARPLEAVQVSIVEDQKLTSSEVKDLDRFGSTVSVSGDVAIVGAPGDDELGDGSGAAYIFRLEGDSWTVEQKLLPSDGAGGGRFGVSVAAGPNVVVVGADIDDTMGEDAGAAYIFRFDGAMWSLEQKLVATNAMAYDLFGTSVAISGSIAVVGAHRPGWTGLGSAYVFRHDGSAWAQEQEIFANDSQIGDFFGSVVAASGDALLVGAQLQNGPRGAAYVFRFNGATWSQEQKLTVTGDVLAFGIAVALDADVAVVGATGARGAGDWSGATYVFRRDGTKWGLEQTLVGSDVAEWDNAGCSVSVHGNVTVIGAYGDDDSGEQSGAAYAFVFDGENWVEEQKLVASDGGLQDQLGTAVAVSGCRAVVGAPYHDRPATDQGAAYGISISRQGTCFAGTVNSGAGLRPTDVLKVNGEHGCVERTVEIRTGEAIEILMDGPPAGPSSAPFALYAWQGSPTPSTISPQPYGLGTMCFPSFLTVGTPKPTVIWNNTGRVAKLGTPDFSSTPAPSVVAERIHGAPRPLTITFQGFIADDGSAASIRGSVTNAVVLRIVP